MIPAATRYERASDVEHALQLLAEPDAKAIAGGQSLIPVMKLRIARPSLVVDISRLELRGVEERDGALHIGPLTTWNDLIGAEALARPGVEAIAECARGIGDLQVRNLGTIGGSLVHADPASDMPAVLLALGATLRVRSPAGERELALGDLLVGPFMTTLGPQELVTDIVVPLPPGAPVPRTRASSIPPPDSRLQVPQRSPALTANAWPSPESARRPSCYPPEIREQAIADAEIFGDRFASAEYRRELAAVLAERALATARERATR